MYNTLTRKRGFVVSAILLCLILSACGSGSATSTPTVVPTSPPKPTATAAPTVAPATESADASATDDSTDTGGDEFYGDTIQLDPLTIAPGAGKVVMNIHVPDGYVFNNLAPFTLHVFENDITTVKPTDNDLKIIQPKMPVSIAVTLREGKADLMMETHIYYCEAVNENLCFPLALRFVAPITVAAGGNNPEITVDYTLKPPGNLKSGS